ncbi:MerR family transcriptional regulator [Candidatus Dependentiae bacterium]|nr:MerR family transcriptional regulator [Candidatus Dependentiae bacterium]
MKMEKRRFRIGQLAKHLGVEKFVIRFWEKEFNLVTHRSSGGQRFYDEKDLEQFKKIRELLYERGFTIAGAQKQLEKDLVPITVRPSIKTNIITPDKQNVSKEQKELESQLRNLQKQLVKLRELL